MKLYSKTLMAAFAAGALALFGQNASAVVINFSSQGAVPQGEIVFNGSSFSFTGDADYNGVGGAVYTGSIGGTFNVGTVTSVGGAETANVTGSGAVTIHDGFGGTLTATVSWTTLSSFVGIQGLTAGGTLNLTNILYNGTQSDLQALAVVGSATDIVSFQVGAGENLDQIIASSPSTTYSGSITVPDGGATVALLGMALSGVAGLGWCTKVRRA